MQMMKKKDLAFDGSTTKRDLSKRVISSQIYLVACW